MSLRLGEALIRRGIIDQGQLKQALDSQLIYGGHLGTCLIDLGLVDVDLLAEVLGEQFRIKHADRRRIETIEPDVVATLPRKLVERHQAVPFELAGRVLRVAMVDPRNLVALDELSFASGYRVEAWIAPEVLIIRAMERCYEIPRKLRHVPVASAPLPARQASAPRRPEAIPPPPPEEIAALRERLRELAERNHEQEVAATGETEAIPAETLQDLRTHPFVTQRQPQIGGQRVGLALEWMKEVRDQREHWCGLFTIPLDDPHFDGLVGVYVVWHLGRQPVLRVGAGMIRERLARERQDPALAQLNDEGPLYVTWARVTDEQSPAVERYLVEMLNPQVVVQVPQVPSIAVNLPR